MSAAPRYPSEMGYAGLRMTADEYLSLGETPDRYELIEGVVVMSPSPTPLHQLIVAEILRQAGSWSNAAGERAYVLPDTDVRLDKGLVYRPDVAVYGPGRLARVPARLETPPDLIVEVLSGGSKSLDLITKREDYERFGVGEYWVVDPAPTVPVGALRDIQIRCWQRHGGQLVETPTGAASVPSSSLSGFTLDLEPLRELRRRAE